MRLIPRAVATLLIFAVLAGPAQPGNWLLGAVLGLVVAAVTLRRSEAATGANPLRLLLLPWFVLGVLGRTAVGTWKMLLLLLVWRDWSKVGFVTCPAAAESDEGSALLALVETASPGSVVAAHDHQRITASVVGKKTPEAHCEGLHRWYRRFQKPMLP